MRAWYENHTDREREIIITDRFCAKWPVTPRWPLPLKRGAKHRVDGHSIDFDVIDPDGRVRLRVEAKYRDHRFGHYRTILISLLKVKAAYAWWWDDEIPVFFAVAFKCGKFAYADLCYPAAREVKLGGRTDRNDPKDQELVVHIPLDQFREF